MAIREDQKCISVIVDMELFEDYAKMAKENGRSISSQTAMLIKEFMRPTREEYYNDNRIEKAYSN